MLQDSVIVLTGGSEAQVSQSPPPCKPSKVSNSHKKVNIPTGDCIQNEGVTNSHPIQPSSSDVDRETEGGTGEEPTDISVPARGEVPEVCVCVCVCVCVWVCVCVCVS